jgi:hypothetical protein
MRKKALRKGVWYNTLDKAERGIVGITIKILEAVQSETLGVEIVKIANKLRNAMKSRFTIYFETFSLKEAIKIAEQAEKFGNQMAQEWIYDFGFTRYLTVMNLNRPSGWGIP